MVHLEDFMVNLSRYKLSPINNKLQHQLVWSAPEWMDRKRHSRDFSPRATLFRYRLTWFRLKEEDYKVVTTVISSFQNERQASHCKFNIFHRWALTLPVPLGTWSREPVGTKEGGIWPKQVLEAKYQAFWKSPLFSIKQANLSISCKIRWKSW